MADKISATRRSANMRAIRSANTKPEHIVRRIAHSIGLRFKLHDKTLPGNPDLVFPRHRRIVFVHGCFWHGHGCRVGGTGPKSNVGYWAPKIARNQERDAAHRLTLEKLGWSVIVIWECETRDVEEVESRLKSAFQHRAEVTKKPQRTE